MSHLSRPVAVVIGALALLACRPPAAHAGSGGCGMAGCPLEARGAGTAGSRFSFDLAYQSVDQNQLWDGSGATAVGATAAHTVDLETRTRAWVGVSRARITSWLGLSASLAYFDRTHRQLYQHHPGFFVPYEWSYSGFGDLMLTGAVLPFRSLSSRIGTISLLAGLKLPTGDPHVQPVVGVGPPPAVSLEPSPAVRLGTGSVDALIGAQVAHPFGAPTIRGDHGKIPLTASASYVYAGKGTDGYRVGREAQVSLDTGYPVLQSMRLVGQASAIFEGRDDVGTTAVAPHHSGGSALLVTPGIRIQISPALATYAYYQDRVWGRTNGPEVVAPAQWLFGTSFSFGL